MYSLSEDESEASVKTKPLEEDLDVGPTKYAPKTNLTKPWAKQSQWGSMLQPRDNEIDAPSKLNQTVGPGTYDPLKKSKVR